MRLQTAYNDLLQKSIDFTQWMNALNTNDSNREIHGAVTSMQTYLMQQARLANPGAHDRGSVYVRSVPVPTKRVCLNQSEVIPRYPGKTGQATFA